MKNYTYLAACAAAPVLAIAGIFAFVVGYFPLAWCCALGVVICMEARVQSGGRTPHTTIFWLHLLAAVPFFLLLTALAFFVYSPWLELATVLFGLVALLSGSILWYRGLEARVPRHHTKNLVW